MRQQRVRVRVLDIPARVRVDQSVNRAGEQPLTCWALDLGTSNTAVARWDAEASRPRLVELRDVCRRAGRREPLEAPRLVPSATHLLPARDFASRVGRWGFVARHAFVGRLGHIGREALERNEGWASPCFAPSFKGVLGRDPLRTLARVDRRAFGARDVARVFFRELLAAIKAETGERVRDLVLTAPVESFDGYRAELSSLARSLGVRHTRFIDEPVAAAIGYGLGSSRRSRGLVVDFGGGTLDLALVELEPREVEAGTCRVVAKAGRPLGGQTVDTWILSEICRRLGVPQILHDDSAAADSPDHDVVLWRSLMLDEARRVKEAVYFEPEVQFELAPPDALRSIEARLAGVQRVCRFSQADLGEMLAARGLYDMLDDCVHDVISQAGGIAVDAIHDVLMVGGSSLLPNVYGHFEARFGRERVRAWQPFEAVAYGACAFGAGSFGQSDFIVHDYAIRTYDPETNEPEHTVVVPHGTRFPTPDGFWRRQFVPTCSLGEPERIFKLVVCELTVPGGGDRRFAWDTEGVLHKVGGEGAPASHTPISVPLNESNPALGHLSPPHRPGDRTPRLDIAFGVNVDRWLCADVRDLQTGKTLMDHEPVVRLL